MTSRSFSVQLLSMALVLALAFSMIPLGFTAYADPGTADSSSGKGTLLVSKQATGVESVDDLGEFEFTVTKDGVAAVGLCSIDGGSATSLSPEGRFLLRAGQSALLSELEPGEYVVTETEPVQSGYESTSFSVNGGVSMWPFGNGSSNS